MKTHPSRTFKYSVQSCCFPALLHASCSLKQQSYLHKPHQCLKRIDTWMENLWMRSFAGVNWPRPNTLPNKSNFAFTSCTHFLFVKSLLSKGFLEGQSNPGAVGYLHRSHRPVGFYPDRCHRDWLSLRRFVYPTRGSWLLPPRNSSTALPLLLN